MMTTAAARGAATSRLLATKGANHEPLTIATNPTTPYQCDEPILDPVRSRSPRSLAAGPSGIGANDSLMVGTNDDFADDSSATLGLSHRHRVRRPIDAIAEVEEADLSPATRSIRHLGRRINALISEGYTQNDATDLAIAESYSAIDDRVLNEDEEREIAEAELTQVQRRRKREKDYLGESVPALMRVDRVGHGGSKKGRIKTPKKGTWVCKECHLEFCDHRRRRMVCGKCGHTRGTSACQCYSGRRAYLTVRVSVETKAAFSAAGVTPGQMLETIVQSALRAGGTQALPIVLAMMATGNKKGTP